MFCRNIPQVNGNFEFLAIKIVFNMEGSLPYKSTLRIAEKIEWVKFPFRSFSLLLVSKWFLIVQVPGYIYMCVE